MSGEEPLGLGDATTALAELADLAELETALGQDYPGASLDDVDEERSGAPSAGRPWTTSRPCAGSSASSSGRAT